MLSCVRIFVTPCTVACQAPLSMEFCPIPCRNSYPGTNTGVGSHSLLQGISKAGIELRSPALQVDSLPAESPGEPKNTGVGSLSLLQVIFPTLESNQDLLHCRQVLYQLSHQGSPQGKVSLIIDRKGEGQAKMEAHTGVMQPQPRTIWSYQELGDARNGFSPRASGRCTSLWPP